ncbi:MAG TPA: tRNA (adenosine(37)-N6)-threonylcarbamoyltransferase complex ATPase subunit type 1 TsaE [Rhizomicrobium sp.]|jgi:tRNA threonylcarbamoyladenosine biosynthesis protein TsaE
MAKENKGFMGDFPLAGLADTAALGGRIATGLGVGDAVALEGDLGAGKTTLARAILEGLGVTEDVPSPTFTLVQHYETPKLTVRHYDFYRIEEPSEVNELGLDEALDEGAVLIEWPERAPARIPSDALHIKLTITNHRSRTAHIEGPARWREILKEVHV